VQLVVYGVWSFFCQLHAFQSLFEQGGMFSFQQCLLLNISRPLERWCHLYTELALCVVKGWTSGEGTDVVFWQV
jgi:hypothetical protein